MAKSLRSKSKRAFRKVKRDDPKSDYHMRDKLRVQRLNEKLKVLKSVSDDEEEGEDDDEDEADAVDDGDMAVEGAAPSGSGSVGGSNSKSKGQKAKGDLKSIASSRRIKQDKQAYMKQQKQLTKLYWLLGLLDPDCLTLAQSVSEESDVISTESSTSTSTLPEDTGKISTHGERESSRLEWRKANGLGPRKRTANNSTTFAKAKNYKSPGRFKRTRK